MKNLRWFAALSLFLMMMGWVSAQAPAAAKTPTELDLIPARSFMVMQLRWGDLWQRLGPLGLQARLEQAEDEVLKETEKNLGIALDDLDVITRFYPADSGAEPVRFYSTRKPMNRDKVLAALLKPPLMARFLPVPGKEGMKLPPQPGEPRRKDRQVKGRTVHVYEAERVPQKPALCFLSERLVVFGDLAGVTAALEAAENPETDPFAGECRRVAKDAPAFFTVLNLEKLSMENRRAFERMPVLSRLPRAKCCTITTAIRQGIEVKAVVTFADDTQAAAAQKELTNDVALLRPLLPLRLKEMAHELVEDPDAPEHVIAVLKAIDAIPQPLKPELDGATVRAVLHHACDDQFLAAMLGGICVSSTSTRAQATFKGISTVLPIDGKPVPQPRLPRVGMGQSLQKIAAGFAKYREKHGHYPPPAIYAQDGTPLLSWRVALLPYVGEEKLYQQFKLDEPWYSKHNRPLLKKMPGVYGDAWVARMPGNQLPNPLPGALPGGPKPDEPPPEPPFPDRTMFRMILGLGTAHDIKEGAKPADLADGVEQTLLVVEDVRFNSAGWTRPEGYRFGESLPLPRLTEGRGDKGFYALFADGKVRFVKYNVDEKTFRAMITRNGGEKLAEKDLGEVVK